MKTPGDLARIFKVDQNTVKLWSYKFRDYLDSAANPAKGVTRLFSQKDIMVFALVDRYWEDEPDYQHIYNMLDQGDQFEDQYIRIAYLHTSLFQEPPDGMEQLPRDSIVLGGAQISQRDLNLNIAAAYKNTGDELVRIALSSDSTYDLFYPIFFTYRHAIEVYLKILVPGKDDTHDLARLLDAYRFKYKTDFAEWAKDRLYEFNKIDPLSDTFRYADSKTPLPAQEIMVSIRHLRVVVDHLCTGLKNLILDSRIPPVYLS